MSDREQTDAISDKEFLQEKIEENEEFERPDDVVQGIIRDQIQDTVDRIQSDLEDLDTDERLVVANPNHTRVKHVMDSESGIEMPPEKSTQTGLASLCSRFTVSGTALFALGREYDERRERMSNEDVREDGTVCKLCRDCL